MQGVSIGQAFEGGLGLTASLFPVKYRVGSLNEC